jgi:hypothetical protein
MELMELQADSDLKEKFSDAEMLILCTYLCTNLFPKVFHYSCQIRGVWQHTCVWTLFSLIQARNNSGNIKIKTNTFAINNDKVTNAHFWRSFWLEVRYYKWDVRISPDWIMWFRFSLLQRAYCFNYFFNIPSNSHNIYTLKSTKIHIQNTQHLPLHVSVSF